VLVQRELKLLSVNGPHLQISVEKDNLLNAKDFLFHLIINAHYTYQMAKQ